MDAKSFLLVVFILMDATRLPRGKIYWNLRKSLRISSDNPNSIIQKVLLEYYLLIEEYLKEYIIPNQQLLLAL